MPRFNLPAEVAALISARIAAYATESSHSPYVARFSALPLYVGWTETIGLRPDGQVIRWRTEGEYDGVLPVEEHNNWLLAALVAGTKKYPELQTLLPVRGPDAVDCRCQSVPIFAAGKIMCSECGGLGWLPKANVKLLPS
jgi:hypothetical protein